MGREKEKMKMRSLFNYIIYELVNLNIKKDLNV